MCTKIFAIVSQKKNNLRKKNSIKSILIVLLYIYSNQYFDILSFWTNISISISTNIMCLQVTLTFFFK